MIVSQLWQYPVKGLAGMTLDSIRLEAGKHFPGDRRFAVTNGHPKQDEALAGRWVKKSFFLQMMKFEELAAFDCDMAGEVMTLSKDGEEILAADLATEPGIRLVNEFFAARFAGRLGGLPQLTRVTDGAFTDTRAPWISRGRHSLGEPVWRGHRHSARRAPFPAEHHARNRYAFRRGIAGRNRGQPWRGGAAGRGARRTLRSDRCRSGFRSARAALSAADAARVRPYRSRHFRRGDRGRSRQAG